MNGIVKVNIQKPTVLWSQNVNSLKLKIKCNYLKKSPDFELDPSKLTFGATSVNDDYYSFVMDFFARVKDKNFRRNIFDLECTLNEYEIKIDKDIICMCFQKEQNEWWPRITRFPENSSWLHLDPKSSRTVGNSKLINKNMKMDKVMRKYLILYNIHQSIGFICVFLQFMYALIYDDTYLDRSFKMLAYFQIAMALDVVHNAFDFGGNYYLSWLQICGRVLVLLFSHIGQLVHHPVSLVMYTSWSLVESVRYPYYVAKLLNVRPRLLVWLRYTIWMILYPMGYACEVFVMLETARKCDFFIRTTPFELPMHFGTLIRIFLLAITLPGFIALNIYMLANRNQKLGQANQHIFYKNK